LLDPAGVDVVRGVVRDLGLKALTLRTIAGHDALAIQKRVPASLIFVPSQGGHTKTALADLLNKLNFMFRARANRRRCIKGCTAAIS
jgi:hypothetical protein